MERDKPPGASATQFFSNHDQVGIILVRGAPSEGSITVRALVGPSTWDDCMHCERLSTWPSVPIELAEVVDVEHVECALRRVEGAARRFAARKGLNIVSCIEERW
jgi:hypothetical protein